MEKKSVVFGSEKHVPRVVTDWAESNKESAGVHATLFRGRHVYLLAAGACPTGGFRVAAERTVRSGEILTYTVLGPSPDEFVIQIITYPYELVFSDQPLRFIRRDGQIETEVIPLSTPPL